jgi:hypothetical protein
MVFLVAVHHKNSSRFGSGKQLFEKILIKITLFSLLQTPHSALVKDDFRLPNRLSRSNHQNFWQKNP